jgi:hypothetical protein
MPEMSCGYVVKIGNGTELWISVECDVITLKENIKR